MTRDPSAGWRTKKSQSGWGRSNLEADPSEERDVAAKHPEIIAEIKAAVAAHRETVTPVVNELER